MENKSDKNRVRKNLRYIIPNSIMIGCFILLTIGLINTTFSYGFIDLESYRFGSIMVMVGIAGIFGTVLFFIRLSYIEKGSKETIQKKRELRNPIVVAALGFIMLLVSIEVRFLTYAIFDPINANELLANSENLFGFWSIFSLWMAIGLFIGATVYALLKMG
ncbi:MAG: hypothetical protein GYA24_08020 [Candidatus Lokiarchaeota archaeon]|nr:hypothetical protein [Candidatus Lokiarchaeota archaeon]